jgi:hypothetical protein
MLAQVLLNVTLPHWHTLLVTVMGASATALILLLGFIRIKGRRNAEQTSRESAETHDPFLHGSATEKRISMRRRGNPVKVLVTDADTTLEPEEAWVVDRSVGGLCLRVERGAVEVGAILNVRPLKAPNGTPWTQIEVKSCRKDSEGWELGCRFLKTPPWSVLLLFG